MGNEDRQTGGKGGAAPVAWTHHDIDPAQPAWFVVAFWPDSDNRSALGLIQPDGSLLPLLEGRLSTVGVSLLGAHYIRVEPPFFVPF